MKVLFCQFLVIGSLFLVSCSGTGASSDDQSSTDLIISGAYKEALDTSTSLDNETIHTGDHQVAKALSTGICMWERLGLKDSPDGKYMTNIFLGESFTYLGESVPDKDGKRTQSKIKLSDGTIGWVQSSLILVKGTAGVVMDQTKVYQRPDLLTETDMVFQKMDFIGIKTVQGDWLQVQGKSKGEKWFWEGWIKKSALTTAEVDITFTLLVKRSELEKDVKLRSEKIQGVLANESVNTSQFKDFVASTFVN